MVASGAMVNSNLPNDKLHHAFLGCLNEGWDQLGVPWAENAMGADSCGEKILLGIVGDQDFL